MSASSVGLLTAWSDLSVRAGYVDQKTFEALTEHPIRRRQDLPENVVSVSREGDAVLLKLDGSMHFGRTSETDDTPLIGSRGTTDFPIDLAKPLSDTQPTPAITFTNMNCSWFAPDIEH